MDLSNPKVMAIVISDIAARQAGQLGFGLTPEALGVFLEGHSSREWDLTNVDMLKLTLAIDAVLVAVHGGRLGAFQEYDHVAVREGMTRSACHYLWFC